LTPPTIAVVNAFSSSQDSLTVSVSLDEAGTAWCAAVRDREPPPTLNQVVAAGFMTEATDAGVITVTVSDLVRDTEYDVYCAARDDGTKSAKNDTAETAVSKKNIVAYAEVLATKFDAHVIYDSLGPSLLSAAPPHNAFGVSATPTLTLTFNEDVQAGTGSFVLRATGEGDVPVSVTAASYLNNVAEVSVSTPLAVGKNWRVEVPVGAIRDVVGNDFSGIADGSYVLQT